MQLGAEELDAGFGTALDLRLALWRGHEVATVAALIEFHTIDIEAPASELAGQVHGVSGELAFEGGTGALLASANVGREPIALDPEEPVPHGAIFAEARRLHHACEFENAAQSRGAAEGVCL